MLPEEFVIRVGVDVAQALGYAHREGVIHRDIKVDNILFDAHGNAVVADFGIARAVSGYTGQTGTNMVVGTPQYFAPEQARAKPLDGRADIYSLGRHALPRRRLAGFRSRAMTGTRSPGSTSRNRRHRLGAINPDLSPGFEAAILHCLQKLAGRSSGDGRAAGSGARGAPAGNARNLGVPDADHWVRADGGGAIGRIPCRGLQWRGAQALERALGCGCAAGCGPDRRGLDVQQIARPSVGDADGEAARFGRGVHAATGVTTSEPVADRSLPPKDSVVRPARTVGSLVIEAPDNATISIDGREQAIGNGWRSDSLKPGSYEVSAAVPSPSGCPTSTATQSVIVRATSKVARVRLSPRGCALVSFDALPEGARYVLTSLTPGDSVASRRGIVPVERLMLPVGDYQRSITHERCTDYNDTVHVGIADKLPKRSLLCR